METAFAGLVGLYFAAAVYLMLSRHLIRILLGVALLGNGVNLLIFTTGRLVRIDPAIIPPGASAVEGQVANALPQALILTAIVISFSFFAFLLVLAYRTYQALGSDEVTEMRVAEPRGEAPPPLGY